MTNTVTGRKSKYAKKKLRMSGGSYTGNSPFFENIPEFQHLKPLRMYPHLNERGMRIPSEGPKRFHPSHLEDLEDD